MIENKPFAEFPPQKSKTGFVIEQIVTALRERQYAIGDRLPSERVLAEQMNVGRAAVREALSALQMLEVVERRIGDGTYVAAHVERKVDVNEALASIQENEHLADVWKVRKILEGVLGELAARKASDESIARVRESFERIENAVEMRDYDDYTIADRDFHLAVADAANNPFLMRALQPLLEITHQQVSTQVDANYIDEHNSQITEEHRAILEALERHDTKGVADAVSAHFIASERLFLPAVT